MTFYVTIDIIWQFFLQKYREIIGSKFTVIGTVLPGSQKLIVEAKKAKILDSWPASMPRKGYGKNVYSNVGMTNL